MLNIKHEQFLNLKHCASHIWQQLESPISLSELADHLYNEFDGEREIYIQDSLDFIIEFVGNDIIHIVHEEAV